MKRLFTLAVAAVCLATAFSACKPQETTSNYIATATLKATEGDAFFLEVDDNTALIPSNITVNPFPGAPERRCKAIYTVNGESKSGVIGYDKTYSVKLAALDTVLTKQIAASTGSKEKDDKVFGTDEVGLYLSESGNFPCTMIEDGYLCVSFTFVSYLGGPHIVNLVVDKNDPYTVEFRHNANGDNVGNLYGGYVCFPLKNLPDTGGKTVKLTLKWNSLKTGKWESTTFDYCSRTDWPE